MSADGRTCSLDDPRIVEALQYMVRVYDSLGGIEDVESFQSGFQADEFDPFLTGKVAMKIDGNWTLNNIADFAPGLRFGVAPAPAPAGRESITWSGGHSWAIPAGAGQPDMAFELIRFLNTDRIWDLRYRVEARYAASRGRSFVPVMSPMPHVNAAAFERHVRDSSDLPQRIKGGFLLFDGLMEVSRFRPVTPVGQLLWDEHKRAYEKAVHHTYSPAQALQRGQALVQAELDLLHADTAFPRVDWAWPVAGIVILAITGLGIALWRGGRQGLRQLALPESIAGFAFVSPWLVGLLVLTAGPILVSIVYSFCRYDVLHPAARTASIFQRDSISRMTPPTASSSSTTRILTWEKLYRGLDVGPRPKPSISLFTKTRSGYVRVGLYALAERPATLYRSRHAQPMGAATDGSHDRLPSRGR